MSHTKLTVKQGKFCRAVVTADNHSDAYRSAYNCAKMKPETVNRQAYTLVNSPKITARIAELKADLATKATLSDAELFAEIEAIADSDIGDAFAPSGRMLDIHDMPVRVRKAIKSITVFEEYSGKGDDRELIGYTKKFEFWDKNSAQERLTKMRGMFETDNAQKAGVLSGLPREQVKQIAEEIRKIKEANAAAASADSPAGPGEPKRVTH